jgi:phage shock protein PspC (stress-responsive transcriptional regulator)
MNKTVTINISGIIFHIEEDAFERLQNYLSAIRNRFHAEEGRDEIMMDIEARIAEILTGKTGPNKEVVVMADVEYVIGLLGEPEAISDSEEEKTGENNSKEKNTENGENKGRRRRLYRDTEDKVVGGVCSGLGYYFNVDPLWIRIGFAALFFLFGTSILFYILLLIIMPKAETTTEKLEMRGEPVDINNISRTIKEEMEEFGKRVNDFGKRNSQYWKDRSKQYRSEYKSNRYERRYGNGNPPNRDIFDGIFRVFGKLFSFALLIIGIGLLALLMTGTLTIGHLKAGIFSDAFENLFSGPFCYWLAITSIFLVFGVPILLLIYKGIRLSFNVGKSDRYVGLVALLVWILGIVFACVAITNAVNGFSEEAAVYENIRLDVKTGDTLYIQVNADKTMLNDKYNHSFDKKHRFTRKYNTVQIDENHMRLSLAMLNIVPCSGDSAELIICKTAMGRTPELAAKNASMIDYRSAITGKTITLDNYFSIASPISWRANSIESELRIPIGTVVFLHLSTKDILYNVPNVTNTLDQDMAGRRWKMTERGLECIDCAGLLLPPNTTTVAPAQTTVQPIDTTKKN